MVSISSKKNISKRTIQYWKQYDINSIDKMDKKIELILNHLQEEYEKIPEKERIGKGSVYICRAVAAASFPLIIRQRNSNPILFIQQLLLFTDKSKNNHIMNYAMELLGQLITHSDQYFNSCLQIVNEMVQHKDWQTREIALNPLRQLFLQSKDKMKPIMIKWVKSKNKFLRRAVIEALRPISYLKGLRNPEKNDFVIKILSLTKADRSKYVRKSVGNNLKDLTKYMPEKILGLVQQWVKEAKIPVTTDLASKTKNELGTRDFHLIWTIKQGLRWLQARNPEYHNQIEKILGKNYVLYFDEKRNRRAVKKK
jgi:3-methyladenine DNA glycosylase AlkC